MNKINHQIRCILLDYVCVCVYEDFHSQPTHTLYEQFYFVDARCHVIKLFAKCVLVVTGDLHTCYDYLVSEFCSFSNFLKKVTLFGVWICFRRQLWFLFRSGHSCPNLFGSSRVPVILSAAIIFTRYSTASSQCSVVGIANRSPAGRSGIRVPARTRDFYLTLFSSTGGFFPGARAAGA